MKASLSLVLAALAVTASAAAAPKCAYTYVKKLSCPNDDGDVQKVLGVTYRAICAFDINDDGNDIGSGTRTNTVADCLANCSRTNGCVGISVYRSSSSGNNCFLKSTVDSFDLSNSPGSIVDSYYAVTL